MQAASTMSVRETHTGIVVLVGEKAYKVTKPVVTGAGRWPTPQMPEAQEICRLAI